MAEAELKSVRFRREREADWLKLEGLLRRLERQPLSRLGEEDLQRVLNIDVRRWRQEMAQREEHLKQFDGLPEPIWAAHRRVAADLDAAE